MLHCFKLLTSFVTWWIINNDYQICEVENYEPLWYRYYGKSLLFCLHETENLKKNQEIWYKKIAIVYILLIAITYKISDSIQDLVYVEMSQISQIYISIP